MVIGIDESGNFEEDSVNLYAAVLIRPSRRKKIQDTFLQWEKSLDERFKQDGEVKGHLLDAERLVSFCQTVMRNDHFGIRFLVVGIDNSEETKTALEKQRQKNLRQMHEGVQMYRSQGKEFFSVANEYEEMISWWQAKSMKTLMKVELLGLLLFRALNEAIKQSVYRKFSRELASLEFNIDNSFIGTDKHLLFWKDIVRNQMWHYSYIGGGIIHIVQWNEHHPFVKKFYKNPKSRESKQIINAAFKETIQFHDSTEKFEIRIADLIANVFFRNFVKGEDLSPAVACLRSLNLLGRRPYTLLKLDSDSDSSVPNPYV